MNILKNISLVAILLNVVAAEVSSETAITAASFNATNMTLDKFGQFFDTSPAIVVVFEPVRSAKQPDNLLIVKAENNDTDKAVSLRLNFSGDNINKNYPIPGDRQKVELAVSHDHVTYLARAGDLVLSFDGDRLRGHIVEAYMVPLQKKSAAFKLSGSFDALVDFSCWVSNADSFTDSEASSFRMDTTRNSEYCSQYKKQNSFFAQIRKY